MIRFLFKRLPQYVTTTRILRLIQHLEFGAFTYKELKSVLDFSGPIKEHIEQFHADIEFLEHMGYTIERGYKHEDKKELTYHITKNPPPLGSISLVDQLVEKGIFEVKPYKPDVPKP